MMYMLLGHVSEVIGGRKWEDMVTSHVLERIDMTSSKVLMSVDELTSNNVAKPCIFRMNKFKPDNLQSYM